MAISVKVTVRRRAVTVPVESYVGVPAGGNDFDVLTRLGGSAVWLPPTGGGGEQVLSKLAHQALSGHRAVYLFSESEVDYPDPTNYQQVKKIVGLTKGAASAGGVVEIQTSGLLVEPSWNFSLGDVWLGSNGLLTQTPPNSGNLVLIGAAVSATALQIDIQFLTKL